MYKWRRLSEDERDAVLRDRKGRHLPWHRPPHLDFEGAHSFIVTAACFEHQAIIGKSLDRLGELEQLLVECCEKSEARLHAWSILPNHYHLLAHAANIDLVRREIGKVHGRTGVQWNREDGQTGRKVWFNYFDRDMKSRRHFWATKNYIHNNPVHHGYVEKWQDWPFSSVHQYLEEVGREKALRNWKEYPALDYGKDWDVY